MRIRFPVLAIAASLLSACIVELPSGQLPPSLDDRQPVFTQGTAGRNPIIQSFTANPSNVTKGQPITFQVVASDPERNPLQLNWAATDGTLSTNTGQVVSWIPPEKPGVYSVTVTVANGRGGFVTGTQNLTVQENGSAVIGGKPPSAPPSALPSPVPSLLPSPVPASPTPIATVLPSVAPPASSAPSSAPDYIRLPFNSQDVRYFQPMAQHRSHTPSNVKLKVTSASKASYTAYFTEVVNNKMGLWNVSAPTATGSIDEVGTLFETVYVLYFVPDKQTSTNWLAEARLADGATAYFGFKQPAASFSKSNVTIPAELAPSEIKWPDMTQFTQSFYAFKYAGQPVDLGTFDLP